MRINLAQMNDPPFTACLNSVWSESYHFVKFAILSPSFCDDNNNKGPIPINDMQTPSLKSCHIRIKNSQCSETYEKSIFRFLFLELP